MQPTPPIIPRAITASTPNQDQVLTVAGFAGGNATLAVSATATGPAQNRIFARIIGVNDAVQTFNDLVGGAAPPGCLELTKNGDVYTHPAIPIDTLSDQLPVALNNKKVVYAAYLNNTFVEVKSLTFVAMPPTTRGAVDARACLWLTYAPTTFAGPFGETTSIAAYVPQTVAVPDGVNTATVTATGGLWRHDPAAATETGAAGRPGTDQPLDPAFAAGYKTAAANSTAITSGTFPLNRLVALWQYAASTTATTELDVGTGKALAIPAGTRPKFLRLGLHDGFQWSNNQGSVTVTVTWS